MVAKIGVDTAENEPSKVRGFLIGVGGVISFVYLGRTLVDARCAQATDVIFCFGSSGSTAGYYR